MIEYFSLEILLYYLLGTAWMSYAMVKPSPKEEKTKKEIIKDFAQSYLGWILMGSVGIAGVWIVAGTFNLIESVLAQNNFELWVWPVKIIAIIFGWGIVLGVLMWITRR